MGFVQYLNLPYSLLQYCLVGITFAKLAVSLKLFLSVVFDSVIQNPSQKSDLNIQGVLFKYSFLF